MGKELSRLKRRKEAKSIFSNIDSKREMYLIVHYSCESFYDIKDGRTPRVTSIAVRNFSNGQTHSFSIHKCAEQNGVLGHQIAEKYDELERKMLDEYFDFVKSRYGCFFIHWNMRDINYGFQAIEHRYKVLGGDPFIIDDLRKLDIARLLISMYGENYVPHGEFGRFYSLTAKNSFTSKDILSGAQEADAFVNKEYIKLHQSTLRKVDVMANMLERILNESLKTDATWRDTHGVSPQAIVEFCKEHWALSILAAFVGAIGFVASLAELF